MSQIHFPSSEGEAHNLLQRRNFSNSMRQDSPDKLSSPIIYVQVLNTRGEEIQTWQLPERGSRTDHLLSRPQGAVNAFHQHQEWQSQQHPHYLCAGLYDELLGIAYDMHLSEYHHRRNLIIRAYCGAVSMIAEHGP